MFKIIKKMQCNPNMFRYTKKTFSNKSKQSEEKLNENYIKKLNKKIIEYDTYRMDNYPHIPIFKVGIILTGATLVTFGIYLTFKPHIHKYIANEGAQIAGTIVVSPELKNSLKAMLEDPELLGYTQELIKKQLIAACNDEEIKLAITNLLIKLLSDQAIQNTLVDTAINFINRQEIQDQLSSLIIAILNREDVRNKVDNLVDETCGDDANREHLKNMINAIFTSQETKDALYELASSLFTTSIFGKKPKN